MIDWIARRGRGLGAVGVAFAASLAGAGGTAAAAPVSVTVRVEGARGTIDEGQVTTDGHRLTTASGGTHPCDGTNGGANPSPGPTATAALDDAARAAGFGWDGSWFDSFQDFSVSRIAGESQTATQFWALVVNYKFSQLGGCQQRVHQGDEVLWAFDGFSKSHVLRLAGPSSAHTDDLVPLHVTDGQDGSPLSGATVGGATTDPNGMATVRFGAPGVYRLKAERSDAIRSNALVLCVDPAGAPPCTSSDHSAPALRLLLPGRFASDGSRSRTVLLSWQADDGAGGSGVGSYDVDVRDVAAVAPRASARGWRPLARGLTTPATRFRGRSGATYELRVTAIDRAGNRGSATATVVVPIDDRDRRLFRLSHGWQRLRRNAAWGRFVVHSRRAGASARVRFHGRRVALIGRRLPRGGRLRVSVDGHRKVLRLRGQTRFRSVLYVTAPRGSGSHLLGLRALGGGPVELDAVAPVP